MKVGKHTSRIIDFLSEFADGEMSRYDFEMDYSGYVIEYIPKMEKEDYILTRKFAHTVDSAYEFAQTHSIYDDDFRIMINNAICDLLGIDEPDLI